MKRTCPGSPWWEPRSHINVAMYVISDSGEVSHLDHKSRCFLIITMCTRHSVCDMWLQPSTSPSSTRAGARSFACKRFLLRLFSSLIGKNYSRFSTVLVQQPCHRYFHVLKYCLKEHMVIITAWE